MSHKGIDYHLHVLATAGLVQVRRSFGHTRVYPTGLQPKSEEEARRRAAVDHPIACSILAHARERPVTRRELLEVVTPPTPRATLNWHVRRLIDVGALAEDLGTGALVAASSATTALEP